MTTKQPKRRAYVHLVASMRRADKAGKSKKDVQEEIEADWRTEAEQAIADAEDISRALTADGACELCDNGWQTDYWGRLVPCSACTKECRG